jgi:3-oxoacyl-[acyl-carrier protein] reductase
MNGLAGKVALVTGAGSGIGRACAQRLAAEGARLGLIDHDAAALAEVQSEIPDSLAFACSVTDESAVTAALSELTERLGPLTIAVCCAGIQLFGKDSAADQLELDVWRSTLEVNLTGTFLCAKHAIRAMLRSGGGSLVLTGSPTGMRGLAPGFDAYSASKAGVAGLVRVLCADYGRHNIRVNGVIPGFTETPLVESIFSDTQELASIIGTIPLGRPGRPEEIAAAVAYLVSDDASYVTGALLAVDGGVTAT